jgi:hypothetical protein
MGRQGERAFGHERSAFNSSANAEVMKSGITLY